MLLTLFVGVVFAAIFDASAAQGDEERTVEISIIVIAALIIFFLLIAWCGFLFGLWRNRKFSKEMTRIEQNHQLRQQQWKQRQQQQHQQQQQQQRQQQQQISRPPSQTNWVLHSSESHHFSHSRQSSYNSGTSTPSAPQLPVTVPPRDYPDYSPSLNASVTSGISHHNGATFDHLQGYMSPKHSFINPGYRSTASPKTVFQLNQGTPQCHLDQHPPLQLRNHTKSANELLLKIQRRCSNIHNCNNGLKTIDFPVTQYLYRCVKCACVVEHVLSLWWALCRYAMGISRDSFHKRRSTGGKRKPLRKKRKFELGRPAANTKIGPKRIHVVRCRGGNKKYRALRLDNGNYSWGSEAVTRKTRILDVVYNASNNELVRTKTLVKNCIVQIDSTPFKQWYEMHYGLPIGHKKKSAKEAESSEEDPLNKKRSNHLLRKLDSRKAEAKVDSHLEEQFTTGRIYACVASRPGQSGRCDGYILEGKELEFYLRKLKSKKGK